MDGPVDVQSPQEAGGLQHESLGGEPRSRFEDGQHRPHFLDRVNVIYKYRRMAVSIFLLILLGSLLRTYTTTPLYRAQARLMIEMEDNQTAALAGAFNNASIPYWQDPQVYYQTQYRVLTGREVVRRVVEKLDLGHVPEFSAGATPTGLKGALSSLLSKMGHWPGRFVQSPRSAAFADTSPTDDAALIGAFEARLSVDPVLNSRLVDVGFISADAAFAARAVNALVNEYVQQNLELRRQNVVASLDWLSQELVKQQQKVEGSERAMAQYREDQNALSLEERQNIVVARLNQLNDAVTKAKTTRVQKEALYNEVKNLGVDFSADTIPAILQNTYIQGIKMRLAELERQKATLLERYGDKYPEVLTVNASLADTSKQLQTEIAKAIQAIKNDYQSAVAEEQTLSAALEDQKAAAMDLNRKSVSYTVLERDAHSNRQVYESLLQREKELQVLANSRGNNVRLIDQADVPDAPFVPTPRRDLLLAVVAGLVLSLGAVFLRDHLDDTIKSPDDVTGKVKLPLLGLAPVVANNVPPLLSRETPHEFAEAFRSLRTSLIFSTGSKPTRLVLVTSSQPLEGKTTGAINLALALALGGTRVLLVDADMRRPAVDRILSIENRAGLSHVLTGQSTLDDALVSLQNPPLWVLTAGVPPPNPSELLGSDAMRALIDTMKSRQFEWVVFDTPPVLPVTDAVVLSRLVDGIAFVIGAEMTQRQHVLRAIRTLAESGSHLLGVILSRADLKRNRYYYSRYYGYSKRDSYFTPPAA